ncbi:MAG: translation initiation factor IF-3 [Ignavibacteria bacterium]|nr:translation initiation factor IF-3 [Ignavibacteria bacterium]MDH7528763.1 translation initiation factor IF-3 [Ignavibacteria bacterium]NPV10261.1 translation initiation factor IF-3 [Ignavibacteria bacterium]
MSAKDSNRELRINEQIRVPQIRVIDTDGTQLGIMSPREALKIAESKGLDLVEIVPQAKPPVCKIIDYGKYRYEVQKKEKTQRKKQAVVEVKEIRFHPNTDEHDFEFKARHCRQFLLDGYKVKATVIYKGRELIYPEKGEELLNKLIEKVSDIARVESPPKFEGRSMTAILILDKSKVKKSN